ncbi:hypothetical protein LEMLEM_LOCUS14732, partial [Lemmus lemmus]
CSQAPCSCEKRGHKVHDAWFWGSILCSKVGNGWIQEDHTFFSPPNTTLSSCLHQRGQLVTNYPYHFTNLAQDMLTYRHQSLP